MKAEKVENNIVSIVTETRKRHRNMGARVLYHKLQIEEVGINKFERIVSENGLSVKVKKRRIVTTDGYHEECDENLINGMILTNINQAIAGDITYLILKDKTYYVFSLKDMYSKRIVGLYASERMFATNAVITLNQVLKLRGKNINGCIHHTDAGSQYKSDIYKELLKKNKMRMSIAENCLQNGMAEQLNGVLKNDYIIQNVKNVNELNRQLTKIMRLINEERPVKQIGYKTPVEFEKSLMAEGNKLNIALYDFEKQNEGTFKRHNNKKSLID